MTSSRQQMLWLVGVWTVLLCISLFSRSYAPIDETRYVTVAWDMWQRGDFLVPYLNGEPYSHKPPLLFWLMQLGWLIFGVNDWWPRLVPALFGLGAIFLTARLASELWPQQPVQAKLAPIMLLGTLLWMLFGTSTMFDMLVAFFTVLGVWGLLTAWQGKTHGWLIFGIAIGGGLLAKGPTILMQLLPLAILAPWWGKSTTRKWGTWYLGIIGAIVLGAVIALAWAIPAGLRGGDEYQHAIFWGQTANRMVNSFAHKRPIYWYLQLLPFILFPWLFWVSLWRGLWRVKSTSAELGVRLTVAWLIPVFLAFSFISGKQVHYLLPILPAFALLATRGLILLPTHKRQDLMPLVLAGIIAGVILLYLPIHASAKPGLSPWLIDIPAWGGITLIAGAILLVVFYSVDLEKTVKSITLFCALVFAIINVAVIHQATGSAYDVRPISAKLKQLEDANIPLAHCSKYHGTFNFLGRLKQSPERSNRYELSAWFEKHPDGRAIVYFTHKFPRGNAETEFLQRFQGQYIAIVNRSQWSKWWETAKFNEVGPQPDSGEEDDG